MTKYMEVLYNSFPEKCLHPLVILFFPLQPGLHMMATTTEYFSLFVILKVSTVVFVWLSGCSLMISLLGDDLS